jgi:hypothetical protein
VHRKYADKDEQVIFKLLRSPVIDSKRLIPSAYVAWWAGTITLFLLVLSLHGLFKIPAQLEKQCAGLELKGIDKIHVLQRKSTYVSRMQRKDPL